MSDKEKAKIILESLDKKVAINWNMEKYYLAAIQEGLRKVREQEEINIFKVRKVTPFIKYEI